jgi:hypothetical protein
MHKFIYFSLGWLAEYDKHLLSTDYQHHKWFYLPKVHRWPNHINSRCHRLDTPWPLAETIAPLPNINNYSYTDFDQAFDIISLRLAQLANTKHLYVCWSGGIDSTCILVGLLKFVNINNITVLLTPDSIRENPYFYKQFIENKISTQSLDSFEITTNNYNKLIVVDGECGNQCHGSSGIHSLVYQGRADLLNVKWKDISNLQEYFLNSTDFAIDLITQSAEHAPVSIDTLYDLLWWSNFNFKTDDNLLKKMSFYTKNLSSEQCQEFWNQGIFRPWMQPEIQAWSMLSKDIRREKSTADTKYFAKKYIHDFDHNDYWFSNKKEEVSLAKAYDTGSFLTARQCLLRPAGWGARTNDHVFAIDTDWKKYSILNREDRKILGSVLQRSVL